MSAETEVQDVVESVDPLELEEVLRSWATSQAPEQDFSGWKMAVVTMPAQVRNGPFFVPGEMVLCRPAPLVGELAQRMRMLQPMQVWSFDLKKEILVNRGLLSLQTGGFEVVPPPVADAGSSESDAPRVA